MLPIVSNSSKDILKHWWSFFLKKFFFFGGIFKTRMKTNRKERTNTRKSEIAILSDYWGKL